jgi:hypothetical protein
MYIFSVCKVKLQAFKHLVILRIGNTHRRTKNPSSADDNKVCDYQLVKAIQFDIGSLY